MSEVATAEEYRSSIDGTAFQFAKGATQKASEMIVEQIISNLEIGVVDNILRSQTLTTALTEVALVSQLNAASEEAFRQASLFTNTIEEREYHRTLGFQLRERAVQASNNFINQFANNATDFRSAVAQVFNITGEVASTITSQSLGAIVSYVDLTFDLEAALEQNRPPEDAAVIIANSLISTSTTTIAGITGIITSAVNTGAFQLTSGLTVQIGLSGAVTHVIARAGIAGAAIALSFNGGTAIGEFLNDQPVFRQGVADLVDFVIDKLTIDTSVEAFPGETSTLAFLLTYLDGNLSATKANEILDASAASIENQRELINLYNSVTTLLTPSRPLLEGEVNEQTFINAVLETLKKAQEDYPITNFSFSSINDFSPEQIEQGAFSTEGVAFRYALQELNPFILIGNFEITGVDAIYDQHNQNGELDFANYSSQYWQDRALFLNAKVQSGLENSRSIISQAIGDVFFEDKTTGDAVSSNESSRFVDDKSIVGFTSSRDGESVSFAPINFNGFRGDDRLYGDLGNDILVGGAGKDTLEGNLGNDTLVGGSGSDTLIGGKGNDFLYNNLQSNIFFKDNVADTLKGGAGFDTYFVGNKDIIEDSNGEGRVVFGRSQLSGGVTNNGGTSYERLGVDGNLIYKLNGATLTVTLESDGSSITINNFTDGYLGIKLDGSDQSVVLAGSNEDDNFGVGTDAISAGDDPILNDEKDLYILEGSVNDIDADTNIAGPDDILSGAPTLIIGGLGDDRIQNYADLQNLVVYGDLQSGETANDGNDFILLDAENLFLNIIPTDTLNVSIVYAGGGDDFVGGSQRNDQIYGGSLHDFLAGNYGNDILFGGSGNDWLQGNANSDGADFLYGNEGNDRLYGGAGIDILFGGDDDDILYGDNDGGGYYQTDTDVFWNGATETITVFDDPFSDLQIVTQEVALNESGDDQLDGGAGNDTLFGGAGNDTLRGRNDNDKLYGEGGDDILEGGSGRDTLWGDKDSEIFASDTSEQMLDASDPDDIFIFRSHADGVDVAGNDTLDGGSDSDKLFGGGGSDTYKFGVGYGQDIIEDSSGTFDSIQFNSDVTANDVSLVALGNDLLIILNDQDRLLIKGWYTGESLVESIRFADGLTWFQSYIETETGKEHDENAMPQANVSIGFGQTGADIGSLSAESDTFFALDGNDLIISQGGDDTVFGGDGDDKLYGNEGNDVLSGEDNNDELFGQIGNDEIYGGEGNDILSGEQGDDTLSGGIGDDDLLGGIGNDTYTFAQGDGQDVIVEEGGTDTLVFAEGIKENNLVFTRDNNVGGPDNLVIQLRDGNQFTNDAVVIENWFTVDNQVENISFADGSTLDVAAIQARLPDTQIINTAGTFVGGAGITSYEILPDNLTDNFTITIDDQGGLDRLDIDEGFYSNGSVSGFASVELISTSRSDNDLTLNIGYSGPEGSFDFSGSVVITNYYTSAGFIEDIFISNQLQNAINTAPVVNGVIPEQVAEPNQAFSLQLANDFFTDSNFDRLSISATLADGSELPSWLSFDANTLSFNGTPTLGDANIQDIRITVTDAEGLTASSDFTLFTGDINLAPRVDAPIDDQTVNAQDTLSFTVDSATFADANTSDTLSLSATLANGDALPGWLSFDAATQTFSGTPSDIDVGELDVRVMATDDDGAFISDNFILTVNPFNTAPEAVRETVSINLEDAGSQQIEFILNEDTTTQRNDSNVTALSNGNYVYTWSELTDNRFTIQARIYDSNYQLIKDDFELLPSESTGGHKITSLESGGFAVTYIASEGSIQRFDNNGNSVGDKSTFISDFSTFNEMELVRNTLDVTSRADGSFVVVWAEDSGTLPSQPSRDAFKISGVIVNTDNSITTFEPSAIEYYDSGTNRSNPENSSPTVSSLNNGAFIVSWGPASKSANDDFASSYFATFDANANRTSEQLFSLEGRPLTTTAFDNDRYLISFSGSEGRTGQFVNSSGGLIDSAFVLNPNNQAGSSVITALSNNDYVMLGIDFDATTGERSLIASRITQAGEITVFNVSDSFNVNRNIINNIEDLPSVAELSDGSLVFTWTTDDPDEVNVFDNDIATRIFPSEAQTSAFLIDVLANDTDIDGGDTLTLQNVSVDPDKGSVSIENNQVKFDPSADFSDLQAGDTESLEVTYTIADAQGETSTVTSTFIIRGFGSTEGGINLNADVSGVLNPGVGFRSSGDINNDGLDDIVVLGETILLGPDDFDTAKAYVVFGSTERITTNLDITSLDGTNGFVLTNNSEYGLTSVESAGDINGDGIDDLIIGSGQTSVNGNFEGGAAYVLYGDDNGFDTNIDLSLLNGIDGFQITGLIDEQNIGGSVDGAGDFNGDGINDLIISLPQFSVDGSGDLGEPGDPSSPGGPGGSGFEGATYVVFGGQNNFNQNIVLDNLDSNDYVRLIGESESYSGEYVATAGDVNADGFEDVLISSSAFDGLPSAHLLLGNENLTGDVLLSDLNGSNGTRFYNSTGEYGFYNALGNAGDINADGISDFVVGNAVIFGSETIYSAEIDTSTLDGTNGFIIDDTLSPEFVSVSAAGDVNADGIDDLLIGLEDASANSNDYAGLSYIVFGKSSPYSNVLDVSTLTEEEAIQFNGTAEDALSGELIRDLGDIDGDGFDDIGIYSRDSGGESITHIIYGKDYRNEIDILGTTGDDIITVTEDNQTVFALAGDDIINIGEVENTKIVNGQGAFEVNVSDSPDRSGFSIRSTRSSSSNSNGGGFNTLNINSRNGSYIARVTGSGIVAVNVRTGETATSWSNRRGSLILDINDGQFEFVFEDIDVDNLLDITAPFSSITINDELALSYEDIISAGFDVDGTELNDELLGSQVEDRVNALAGNDTITTGEGDDYINAGAGDDDVNAGKDNDYIIGGKGFDLLNGGLGDDTYLYNLDDGSDSIIDAGGIDQIIFGAGISASDIRVATVRENLIITVNSNDSIIVEGWQDNVENQIEQFIFTDDNGLTLNASDIEALAGGAEYQLAPFVINPAIDQTVDQGSAFNFTIPSDSFIDKNSDDAITYSASLADDTALPSWLSFDAATQTFSGTPENEDVGNVSIKVTAKDSSGLSVSDSFSVTVNNTNDAPVLDNGIADQSVDEDSGFSFTVPSNTFSDVDSIHGDTLSYSATLDDDSTLPSWISFDAATQTFSGTPENEDVGNVSIKVTATDSSGLSVSDSFSVTVNNTNDAPVLDNGIADQSVDEDSSFSFTVPSNTFSDVDSIHGDTLSYSATLSDDNNLPSWLSFDAATQTFSGTPENEDVGNVSIKVTAKDSSGLSVSDSFSVTVNNTNDAPVLDNGIADQSVDEDSGFSFTVPSNTFSDVDSIHGDTLSYSATLDDDSTLPSWISFDAATQTFSGTPENEDVGNVSIKVTATDSSGLSVSDSFSVTVNNTNDAPVLDNGIADQSVDEDSSFSFTVPSNTFSDVDSIHGDTLSYSATLSDDNNLPSWLSFDAATQTFSGTPENEDVGNVSIKVTAKDSSGLSVSDSFSVTVNNTNDAPVLDNGIADQSVDEDSVFSFTVPSNTFSDVDSIHGDTLSYSATLDDDSTLPSWISFDAATQTFSGTPENEDVGNVSIKVTATDSSGLSVSDSFSVTVNNTNDAPVLDNGIADQSVDEDSVFSFTVTSNTFSDVDSIHSDTLSYSATLSDDNNLPSWLSFDATTQTFSGAPENEDVGNVSIKVTATDSSGLSVSDSFSVTVNNTNDAPELLLPLQDQTLSANNEFTYVLPNDTFNDDDVIHGDTLTLTATLSDGSTLPTWLSFDAATQVFSGTPLDGDVGVFDIQVNAIDSNGAVISDTFILDIVDDKNNISGTEYSDFLWGTFEADKIDALSGNDILFGSYGDDTLNGDEGRDRLYGGSGDDISNGGKGNDYINDWAGNNILNGEEGNDYLVAGSGNDVLSGNEGHDDMRGGRGNDIYQFNLGDDRDVIRESKGDDTLRFGEGIEAEDLWFSRDHKDLEIGIIGTEDSIRIDNWYRNSSWWWFSQDYRVETIELSNGQQLLESQVQSLVDAMAGFNVNTSGELNVPQDIRDQLDTTIAASWS